MAEKLQEEVADPGACGSNVWLPRNRGNWLRG